jgi:hypothetical protein
MAKKYSDELFLQLKAIEKGDLGERHEVARRLLICISTGDYPSEEVEEDRVIVDVLVADALGEYFFIFEGELDNNYRILREPEGTTEFLAYILAMAMHRHQLLPSDALEYWGPCMIKACEKFGRYLESVVEACAPDYFPGLQSLEGPGTLDPSDERWDA